MSEYKFQPGDVVVLQSGSPPMTVHHCNSENTVVTCVWFSYHDTSRCQLEEFHSWILKLAEEKDRWNPNYLRNNTPTKD